MTEEKKYQTNRDFGFVAWLKKFKGIEDVREKMVVVKKGAAIFYFEISDDDWFDLRKEYDATDLPGYLFAMKRLKDLTF